MKRKENRVANHGLSADWYPDDEVVESHETGTATVSELGALYGLQVIDINSTPQPGNCKITYATWEE